MEQLRKRKAILMLSTCVLSIFIALIYRPLDAQQVATDILDDVVIERSDYNAVIKVIFKQPFRYISHSPKASGDSINVKVNVVRSRLSLEDRLINNESIILKDDKGTGLNEVVYEEQGLNSNFVSFYFEKNVSFELVQGSDKRSLSIIIFGLE